MNIHEDIDELLRRTGDETTQDIPADLFPVPVKTLDEYKAFNVWIKDKKNAKDIVCRHF